LLAIMACRDTMMLCNADSQYVYPLLFTGTYKDVAEYADLNPNQPIEGWEKDLWPKRRGLIIKQQREPAMMSW